MSPLTSSHTRSFPGWNLVLSVSRNNFLLPLLRKPARPPRHAAEATRPWGGQLPPSRTSSLYRQLGGASGLKWSQ